MLKIDWDHFTRLQQRKSILEHGNTLAIFVNPAADFAVSEMYEWLTQHYLHQRFPTIFSINKSTQCLENVVNRDSFPLQCSSRGSADTLKLIGRMVDEDMMFLLPSDDGDGYALQAYIVCFASGFDIVKMQGEKLRHLHAEVPGYKAKLQLSMERFMRRLEPGRYVQRANVSTNFAYCYIIIPGTAH